MLCSLLFKNCNTMEDYKHALEKKIKIFTVLDFVGLLVVALNITLQYTTLFAVNDFTHGFLYGLGVSMILLSVNVISRTKRLLSDQTKLLNKWEQFNQSN